VWQTIRERQAVLFNSFTYLLFLPAVVILYWTAPPRLRSTLLLIASYVFYMNWKPAYGLLILALTVANYFFGLAIYQFTQARKQLLIAGAIFNIGCLCFFKYANFLIDSVFTSINCLKQLSGSTSLSMAQNPGLNIILPLGISFFTFEFIHYITDVYRGSKPVRNFRDFALFAAFFPSQIAGPIKRFQDFIHQLEEQIPLDKADLRGGVFLILQGLYKKVVLGDNIGTLVGYGFSHIASLGTLDAWLAVVGFTFQIFFDFSGYTDIGRGSAKLLGYNVPENFNWPFLAANLTDFWRRWHMSLSTWLRDYLFIPLGGSRGSHWQVRKNLMITMTLGGLWHGAAWHYVIWGAFHGVGLVLSKDWHDFVSKFGTLAKWRQSAIWHWSGVLVTLLFLFVAGTLFRAANMSDTFAMLQKLVSVAPSYEVTHQFLVSNIPVALVAYICFLALRWLVGSPSASTLRLVEPVRQWWNSSVPARVVACACVAIIILGFAPGRLAPFIYFQF
jgi:D-alanyl-lipoteichoic acid acyltransferase DltB (MBOAT superfamily)